MVEYFTEPDQMFPESVQIPPDRFLLKIAVMRASFASQIAVTRNVKFEISQNRLPELHYSVAFYIVEKDPVVKVLLLQQNLNLFMKPSIAGFQLIDQQVQTNPAVRFLLALQPSFR